METLDDLNRQLTTMKGYLKLRLKLEDWHGVRDAAADIECIVAKISILGAYLLSGRDEKDDDRWRYGAVGAQGPQGVQGAQGAPGSMGSTITEAEIKEIIRNHLERGTL